MADSDEKITTAEVESPAVAQAEPVLDAPVVPSTAPRKRSGFFGGLLGGVLAAGAGYGVAQLVPNGWPIQDTTALQATIDAQAKDIAALRDQIAQMPSPGAAASVDLAPLTDAIAALDGRIVVLEAKPSTGASADLTPLNDAVAKLQADLAALQASGPVPANVAVLTAEAEAKLQEAEAQAAQVRAEAEALAQKAAAAAAVGRLQTAVDTGAPFADLLSELGPSLPDSLMAHAETGVSSLTVLQDSFPETARAALEAALRADMGETWTDRATSFFRSQTGARSLTPQEGNDPDAILSRAEAALATGDLTLTLSELAALPESALPAVAEWRAKAEIRLVAAQAVAELVSKTKE